jgi:hypothetical protein
VTEMVTVIRLAHCSLIDPETGTNYGPYCTSGMPFDIPFLCSDSFVENHPLPQFDGILMSPGHVCGFESFEKLHAWFAAEELDELADCNYVAQIWEVPSHSVRIGNSQVAFRHEHGFIVKTLTLDEILLTC